MWPSIELAGIDDMDDATDMLDREMDVMECEGEVEVVDRVGDVEVTEAVVEEGDVDDMSMEDSEEEKMIWLPGIASGI